MTTPPSRSCSCIACIVRIEPLRRAFCSNLSICVSPLFFSDDKKLAGPFTIVSCAAAVGYSHGIPDRSAQSTFAIRLSVEWQLHPGGVGVCIMVLIPTTFHPTATVRYACSVITRTHLNFIPQQEEEWTNRPVFVHTITKCNTPTPVPWYWTL